MIHSEPLLLKYLRKEGPIPTPCTKTLAKYLDADYAKMNTELKKSFKELDFLSTTADIWTAHNRSYLGMTAHWIDGSRAVIHMTTLLLNWTISTHPLPFLTKS
jgi:hypothetical protein